MGKYRLSDDSAMEVVEAESMEAAVELAEELWRAGSWDTKCVVNVRVAELDGDGKETGNVDWALAECGEDPQPPECTNEAGHDWCAEHSCVGGLKENPGVWSAGGTTLVYKTVCRHCGVYKKETSYGSQRNPGQCDQVEYLPPDEDSVAFTEGGV